MKRIIRSGVSEWMKKDKKGPKCQNLALSEKDGGGESAHSADL